MRRDVSVNEILNQTVRNAVFHVFRQILLWATQMNAMLSPCPGWTVNQIGTRCKIQVLG